MVTQPAPKEKGVKVKKAPKKRVSYQTKTASEDNSFLAYFDPSKNTVTKNQFQNNPETNESVQGAHISSHENMHRTNHTLHSADMSMSMEQYHKLSCHDEISANIAGLLTVRQEYIEAKDKDAVLKKHESFESYRFWIDGVRDGSIDPLSKNPGKFDEEMKTIGTGVKNTWMEKWSAPYDENHEYQSAMYLAAQKPGDVKPNDANYQKAVDGFYTIGGINFSKVMGPDIEVSNSFVKETDISLANGVHRNEILTDWGKEETDLYTVDFVTAKDVPPGLSPEQQYRLSLHETNMHNAKKIFPEMTSMTSDEIREFAKTGEAFKDMSLFSAGNDDVKRRHAIDLVKGKAEHPAGDDAAYEQAAAKIYTVNGVDLRDFADGGKEGVEAQMKEPDVIAAHAKMSPAKRAKSFSKERGLEEDILDMNPQQINYQGRSKYEKRSKKDGISRVKHERIINFDKPFLKEQREKMVKGVKPKPTKTPSFVEPSPQQPDIERSAAAAKLTGRQQLESPAQQSAVGAMLAGKQRTDTPAQGQEAAPAQVSKSQSQQTTPVVAPQQPQQQAAAAAAAAKKQAGR